MTEKLDNYIRDMQLRACEEPGNEDLIYRRSNLQNVPTLAEIDKTVGALLRQKRLDRQLSRGELAFLLGLTEQVYGRYERGETKMNMTRLIQLSEILGFSPLDLLLPAAQHLLGKTQEQADDRRLLIEKVENLSATTTKHILAILNLIESGGRDEKA